MKRTFNLLVLVTLLALTFGAQGVNSVQASEPAITITAAPPAYYPSGPQTGVDESALTGWSVCWSSDYGTDSSDPANLLTTVLSNCDGDYLLLAGGPAASTVFDVLAAAPRADVIFDTGYSNTPHTANGSGWYYYDSWSWGFALAGDPIDRDSCDWLDGNYYPGTGTNGDLRLCWHTSGGYINGGWRSGRNDELGASYRRVIYEAFEAPAIRLFGTTGNGPSGTGGTSNLVELDPTTGALISTIGPVGYLVNGLDYDPSSGMLYATTGVSDSNFSSGLITIDMTTGTGTPVVSLGSPEGCVPTNLRANAGGTLFAWSECYDDLVIINPATGDTFVVGESGIDTAAYGMSFDASNTLYFVNYGGDIYTINKYTGAATFTGNYTTSYAHHGDFHPDSGRYWGIDMTGSGAKNIRVVNIGTGAVDANLPTVNNLHTLTFVPGNQPAVDVVKPILNLTDPIIQYQNAPGGAYINYSGGTATDETSPANPVVQCTPRNGEFLPLGNTPVKCFALDDQGNAAFGNTTITVLASDTSAFTSVSGYDGYLLELNQNSGTGGTGNAFASTINIGDSLLKQQHLGLLHFNTSSLPDNAVVTGLNIQMKLQSMTGTNPFYTHGDLLVDIVSPFFGTLVNLQAADFQAAPGMAGAGTFDSFPLAGNWYSANLGGGATPFLNLTGPTQFRIGFSLDDNNDSIADVLKFYSGNASVAAYRPVLTVYYHIPVPPCQPTGTSPACAPSK